MPQQKGARYSQRAVGKRTLRELQGACKVMEARHPRTRPQSRTNSRDIIAYIVEHLAAAEVAVPGRLQD